MKNLFFVIVIASTFIIGCDQSKQITEIYETDDFQIIINYKDYIFEAIPNRNCYLNIVSISSIPEQINFYREYNINLTPTDTLIIDLVYIPDLNYRFDFFVSQEGVNKIITLWYDSGINP